MNFLKNTLTGILLAVLFPFALVYATVTTRSRYMFLTVCIVMGLLGIALFVAKLLHYFFGFSTIAIFVFDYFFFWAGLAIQHNFADPDAEDNDYTESIFE